MSIVADLVSLTGHRRKPVFGISIKSNPNQPVQLQRLARIVKFRLKQLLR